MQEIPKHIHVYSIFYIEHHSPIAVTYRKGENKMEVVALVVLAGFGGFLYTFLRSHADQYFANYSWLQSRYGQAVLTGAFILVSFVAATFVLRKVKLSKHLPAAVK